MAPAANRTPVGNAPVSLNVAAGKPVAVTGKDPATPIIISVLFALVILDAWLTVIVKLCVASAPAPL